MKEKLNFVEIEQCKSLTRRFDGLFKMVETFHRRKSDGHSHAIEDNFALMKTKISLPNGKQPHFDLTLIVADKLRANRQ